MDWHFIQENRPFAWSGHVVRNKLCWDAINAVGLSKQRNSYLSSLTLLCFESPTALFAPQRNLFRTMWPGRAKGLLWILLIPPGDRNVNYTLVRGLHRCECPRKSMSIDMFVMHEKGKYQRIYLQFLCNCQFHFSYGHRQDNCFKQMDSSYLQTRNTKYKHK